MTRSRVSATSLSDYVPLAVFLTVYVLTCLIGAVFLLLNYRPVVALWEYFSGTRVPDLTGSHLVDAVTLLTLSPFSLALGYWIGTRILVRAPKPREWLRTLPWHSPRVSIAQRIFYALALMGALSLARAGAFEKLDAWLSYQAWIDARWNAFAVLSFFEFVNLYTFIPLAAAWCLLSTRGGSFGREVARWVPVVIAVLLALALFQKKAALISLIIVAMAYLLDAARRDPQRVRRGMVVLCVALTGAYFAMVVVPTFNLAVHEEPALQRQRVALLTPRPRPVPTIQPAVETPNRVAVSTAIASAAPGRATGTPAPTASPAPTAVVEEFPPAPQLDSRIGIVVYSILAPLMRTSAPALYYTIVFPEFHPFYGPDFGLDIVCSHRIGCYGLAMPNDNLVVWDYMNPQLHGGSITAPFQFALYSQAGVPGALVGSLALGAVLAVAWRFARSTVIPPIASDVSSAVVILLAINLALDSPRNSIVVSYGALWGLGFVVLASFATLLVPWPISRLGPNSRRHRKQQ